VTPGGESMRQAPRVLGDTTFEGMGWPDECRPIPLAISTRGRGVLAAGRIVRPYPHEPMLSVAGTDRRSVSLMSSVEFLVNLLALEISVATETATSSQTRATRAWKARGLSEARRFSRSATESHWC
jgi:hypothetical protein